MPTINKQKVLCEDRIVTWDPIKSSNCEYRIEKKQEKQNNKPITNKNTH